MRIKPTGHYVLVKVEAIEDTHTGTSIIMVSDEARREHGGRDIGIVLEFGPTAYKGFAGCESPEHWGVKVGDKVEFNRYDGKIPRVAELDDKFKDYRIINDNDIIAVVED